MKLRLNSLKLARRLALGFCMVLALVVGMAALSLYSLKRTDTASSRIAQALEQAAAAGRWQVLTQLNVSRTLALAKSGNNADVKAFSDPQMKKTSAEITEVQKGLEANAASDEAKAQFADIAAKRKRYIATRDQLFKLLDAGDASAKPMIETELLPQANDYVAAVAAFEQSQHQGAQAVISASHAQAESARDATLMLAALCIALGSLCAWLITRSVTRPLTQAVQAVERVTEGDLSQAITVDGRDEVAQLLSGLDRMRNALRSLVGNEIGRASCRERV